MKFLICFNIEWYIYIHTQKVSERVCSLPVFLIIAVTQVMKFLQFLYNTSLCLKLLVNIWKLENCKKQKLFLSKNANSVSLNKTCIQTNLWPPNTYKTFIEHPFAFWQISRGGRGARYRQYILIQYWYTDIHILIHLAHPYFKKAKQIYICIFLVREPC
jgi:hypothetical protein